MSGPTCLRAYLHYVDISTCLHRATGIASRSFAHPGIGGLRIYTKQRCRNLHHSIHLNQARLVNGNKLAILDQFKSSLAFPEKSFEIADIPNLYVSGQSEKETVLHGYLGARHDMSKKLTFAPLFGPNLTDKIQIISSINASREADRSAHEKLRSLRPHTPVAVKGLLRRRPESDSKGVVTNAKSPRTLQDFEFVLRDIQSLNDFPTDIVMTPSTEFPPSQRHLQIRTSKYLHQALVLRNEITKILRTELNDRFSFVEIETPLLFKSTSEGAREFIVPTRRKNMAYSLPQSPQQFKQILMATPISKYFQFAKCFRDEDLRADRQPEFAQLDLEMSFAQGKEVMKVVESLICTLFYNTLGLGVDDTPRKFPRLTYDEAMSRYGSDKPDLRNPIRPFTRIDILLPADLISKITPLKDPLIEAMVVPLRTSPNEARHFISNFLDSPEHTSFLENPDGGPGIFVYDSSKPLQGLSAFGFEAVEQIESTIDLEDGHLIVLQARKKGPSNGGSTPLGELRTSIHRAAVDQLYLEPVDWRDFYPLWVIDFPLFKSHDYSEPGQGGNAGLASTHHPFTSPKTTEDVDMLLKDPTKAIADHYDLVINGEEIGGGSRRIHHAAMQELIFRDILKMEDERISEFSHLLEALRAGCPPHAGIALGLDRLVAMICSSKFETKMTLRDVIAFPKSGRGEDLMMKSPGPISDEVLKTYHLKLSD